MLRHVTELIVFILAMIFMAISCSYPDTRPAPPINYDTNRTLGAVMEKGRSKEPARPTTTLVDMIAATRESTESPEAWAERDVPPVRESVMGLKPTADRGGKDMAEFNKRGMWPCGIWNGDYTFFQLPSWSDQDAKYYDHCVISSGGNPKENTWLVVGLQPLSEGIMLPGDYVCYL